TANAPCGAPSTFFTAPIAQNNVQTLYSFPLDTNPGWTLGTGWAFGHPTGTCGDPSNGYTGTNVYGYNLSGCYTNNIAVRYLTTTPFDCSNKSDVTLRFRRWLGVEESYYDHAIIQASNDNTNWTTVWEHAGQTLTETAWSLQTVDISSVADG